MSEPLHLGQVGSIDFVLNLRPHSRHSTLIPFVFAFIMFIEYYNFAYVVKYIRSSIYFIFKTLIPIDYPGKDNCALCLLQSDCSHVDTIVLTRSMCKHVRRFQKISEAFVMLRACAKLVPRENRGLCVCENLGYDRNRSGRELPHGADAPPAVCVGNFFSPTARTTWILFGAIFFRSVVSLR